MPPIRYPAVRGLLLLLALIGPDQPASAAGSMYCCQDEQGRRVCAGHLPLACHGRAYREIMPGGRIVEHAAPLTAAQRAEKEAKERIRKEEETRLAAEKARNLALLESYGDASDIDRRRDREVAEIERTIAVSTEQLADLAKRRLRLDRELEFYQGQDLPPDLREQKQALDREQTLLDESIQRRREEQEGIRSKYAEERARYDALRAEQDRQNTAVSKAR
jgi:hypothetical protein